MKTITTDFVGIRWRLAVLLWGFTLACAGQTTPADPKPWLQLYGFAMMDMGYDFKQTHPDWFDVVGPPNSLEEGRVRCGRKYLLQRPADPVRREVEVPTARSIVDDLRVRTLRNRCRRRPDNVPAAAMPTANWASLERVRPGVRSWTSMSSQLSGVLGPNRHGLFPTCNSGGCRSRRLSHHWPWNGRCQRRSGTLRGQDRTPGCEAPLPGAGFVGRGATGQKVGLWAAGIVRRIKWVDIGTDQFDLGSVWGWGVNFIEPQSAQDNVIKLALVYGKGIQNYMNDVPRRWSCAESR